MANQQALEYSPPPSCSAVLNLVIFRKRNFRKVWVFGKGVIWARLKQVGKLRFEIAKLI